MWFTGAGCCRYLFSCPRLGLLTRVGSAVSFPAVVGDRVHSGLHVRGLGDRVLAVGERVLSAGDHVLSAGERVGSRLDLGRLGEQNQSLDVHTSTLLLQ